MPTSFSGKCEILAELHVEADWNDDLSEFKRCNDIGLPLAYLTHLELAKPVGGGKKFIEESWNELCKALKVDPQKKYMDSTHLLEEAGVELGEDEEDL